MAHTENGNAKTRTAGNWTRRQLTGLSAIIITVVFTAPAGAQLLSSPLAEVCSLAGADKAELALTSNRRSPALDAALASESAFWVFLIDPATPYLDRIAAAHQGGGLISPQHLVRLWQASAEFEVLPVGVNPSPCEFMFNAWAERSMSKWDLRGSRPIFGTVSAVPETRIILGFEMGLPRKAIDYPLDVESRNDAPGFGRSNGRFGFS